MDTVSTSTISMIPIVASTATIVTNRLLPTTDTDTQAQPENNAALIGGIVGGIVALILAGGLIAFVVTRSRRRKQLKNSDQLPTKATNYDRAMSMNKYSEVIAQPPIDTTYTATFLPNEI